jgi:ribosomal protein L16/L10AE
VKTFGDARRRSENFNCNQRFPSKSRNKKFRASTDSSIGSHVPVTNMAHKADSSPAAATYSSISLPTSINPSPESRTFHIQYIDFLFSSLILVPRRVRSNKTQKGRIPCRTGHSTKGTALQYGEYGLRLTETGRSLSAKQLQTADNILRKALKDVKGHRIYYRFACGKAVCKKGNEVQSPLTDREITTGPYGEGKGDI